MKNGVKHWMVKNWKPIVALAMVAFVLREAGCSYNITSTPVTGSGTTGNGGNTPSSNITISPQTATIAPGAQLSLSAVVTSFKHDSTVSWSINGTAIGTLTPKGNAATYTAPTTLLQNPTIVTIRARSNEDTTQYAQCTINVIDQGLPNGVSIVLMPLSVTMQTGQTQQFTATISGSMNTGVVWTLVSGSGSLSASGLYTAPASINGTAHAVVQATAVADTSIWAQATITIRPPADTTPCFQREVLPIIISNCSMSGCHSAGSTGELRDLTTYAGVMGYVRYPGNANQCKLYQSITGSGEDKMPPRGHTPLTTDQIALIARWINDGAKNNDCTVDTSSGCDTTGIHYSSFVRSVIQNNCLGCHSGSTASNGIDLSTYSGVQTYALNGQLVGGLTGARGLSQMPQNGIPLDACTIARIAAWVNRGAPND